MYGKHRKNQDYFSDLQNAYYNTRMMDEPKTISEQAVILCEALIQAAKEGRGQTQFRIEWPQGLEDKLPAYCLLSEAMARDEASHNQHYEFKHDDHGLTLTVENSHTAHRDLQRIMRTIVHDIRFEPGDALIAFPSTRHGPIFHYHAGHEPDWVFQVARYYEEQGVPGVRTGYMTIGGEFAPICRKSPSDEINAYVVQFSRSGVSEILQKKLEVRDLGVPHIIKSITPPPHLPPH